jgi:nitronate monooxygenase
MRVPVVQAPMAGGMTTPGLVAAVCEAGGLGSVAGAMLGPEELREMVRAVRALTRRPFAVNVFAPLPEPSTERVEQWSRLTGVAAGPVRPVPRFDDQLAVVVQERVAVLSFTFGIPPLEALEALETVGELGDTVTVSMGTATTVDEAVELERAGVDAVVAQGFEAGGHRGTFRGPAERALVGTLALVPQVADAVSVPVIASGGIMDGRGIAAALVLGAQAVQLGTAFLTCPEAGTSEEHRRALTGATTVTRVLTGRYARAVRTPVVDRLEESGLEPPDYPLPRALTPEPPMLAGQGGPMARSLPAAELMAAMEAETDAALTRVRP